MPRAPDPVEEAILAAVAARGPGKSICPSEVARHLAASNPAGGPPPAADVPEGEEWRAWMPTVRATATRLAEAGQIAVTQKGRAVDPGAARGPIRLTLPPGRSG